MGCHRNPTHVIHTPLWGASVVLWALLCWSLGYGGESPATQPLWSVDLRQWGYTLGHPAFLFPPLRHTISLLGSHPIAVSRGYIAFAFLTQEMGDKHSDVYQSRRQHLISLDAAPGKVLGNKSGPEAGAEPH